MTDVHDGQTRTLSGGELLRHGIRAFQSHDWTTSEAAFVQLLEAPDFVAEACYGIGMARLGMRDPVTAERFFHEAASRDPGHADALYQLGRINEQLRSFDAAKPFYERALAIKPSHRQTRARLAANSRTSLNPQPHAGAPPAPGHTKPAASARMTGQYSVLDFLAQDSTPISKQAAELIGLLHLDRHAYLSAYLLRILVAVLVLFTIGALIHSPLVLVVGILCVVVACARVKATRFEIMNGRIRISSGLVGRHSETHDLWMVHEISIHRTFVNRLTGDGSLVVDFSLPISTSSRESQSQRLVLRGLARGGELSMIHDRLQNLKFLMRANPAMKGIIQ
jgi:hypothetical protein